MRYVFGDFTLDTQLYELRRAGELVRLGPRVFNVLAYLVQYRHRVVPKSELFERLWPDQFVSDDALTRCVRTVRHALDDRRQTPRYIKTVHGRGYHFVAPVQEYDPAPLVLAAPTRPPPQSLPGQQSSNKFSSASLPVTSPGNTTSLSPSRAPSGLTWTAMPAEAIPLASGSTPSAFAGEYKHVTVLSGTLAEARDLAMRLGPERLHHLMQNLFMEIQHVVQSYAGSLIEFGGDGFLALFGAPVAQEDHTRQAVLAALALHQRVAQLRVSGSLPAGEFVALCMGLHTGRVVVGRLGDDALSPYTASGETTYLAIQLRHLAAPGTILASAAVQHLVQEEVQVEACGSTDVDGMPTSVPVYRLLGLMRQRSGVQGRGTRSRSRFVGRERELAMLHERLDDAVSGQGQVVGIAGEPGMGKSRLLIEFCHSLAGKPITYLEGHCFSYGLTTPYLPVLTMVRQLCGITAADHHAAISTKVRQCLQERGIISEDEMTAFLQLLDVPVEPARPISLDPQIRKTRTFAALRHLFLHGPHKQPCVLAIENLHWIDATSEEWLTSLVERLIGISTLLVVTYRPGYRPPWLDKSYMTQLALPCLKPQDSLMVVRSVLPTAQLPEVLIHAILTKAAGNPFFLEELAWTVRETGAYHLPLHVPETIQAVLAARIDRLPPVAKHLLQTAAVIGTRASFPLLSAVTEMCEETLHSGLDYLQTAELLYEIQTVPELAYTFKHALIQDVAYQSLLTGTRQQYHQRMAQVLVEQFPETRTTQPELLAHHYTEAGLEAHAIPHWLRAGQRAIERSAHVESIAHLSQGLELLERLPNTPERVRQELDTLTVLGPALMAVKGFAAPEVERTYSRARALCQRIGDTPQLLPALWGLWRFYNAQAALQTAHELAEQCFSLTQQQHDTALLVAAHYARATTAFYRGEFPQARTHVERGIALYDPQQHRSYAVLKVGIDHGMTLLACRFCTLWLLGYPDQALHRCHEALALAQKLSHPLILVFVSYWTAVLHQHRREVLGTRERAETTIALSAEHGFAQRLATGMVLRGWALVQQGQEKEGIAQIRQGMDAYRATGAAVYHPYYLAILAEAYGSMGQPGEGLTALTEAWTAPEKWEARWYEAELHRLKGELLRAQQGSRHEVSEIETSFWQALDIARQQQAKSLELRAATSLSRFWLGQGKQAEARKLLAGIYGWFTEGFDTADLKEARALLKALS